MIVRQFLHWTRTAPAGERAEAAGALARAYLYSGLDEKERAAAEQAMIILLNDASPLVRRALAEALAASPDAPHAVIHGLASEQADVSAPVLARSPLFIDAELVDLVAISGPAQQAAIASRVPLPCAVAAAIAEVGSAEACRVALENEAAEIARSSINRMVERFGDIAVIRERLLARPDLPIAARQALVRTLSATLADFVANRAWLERERADEVVREACEKATVTIAAFADTRPLIRHLRVSGQLTAGLVLRALLSGNIAMFEDALADLAELPLRRVRALVHDRGIAGFRAVFEKAGLPASTFLAFREALRALHEAEARGEYTNSSRLKRRMVERVLTSCEQADVGDVEPLLVLLRRFAAEAAREDAELYCERLIAANLDEAGLDDDGHEREAA